MECMDRYKKYEDESLDSIILKIQRGVIKPGKYAHRVKIKKGFKLKGKEFFTDGSESDDHPERGQ